MVKPMTVPAAVFRLGVTAKRKCFAFSPRPDYTPTLVTRLLFLCSNMYEKNNWFFMAHCVDI